LTDGSPRESDNSQNLQFISNVLAEIFNVTSVGLVVFDPETRVVIANPAFAFMIANTSVSDCLGKTARELIGGASDLEFAIKTVCDTGVAQPGIDVAAKMPHSGLVNHWLFNLDPIRPKADGLVQVAAIAVETNHQKTIQEYFLTLMGDIGWIRGQIAKDPSVLQNRSEILRQVETPRLLNAVSEEVRRVSAMLQREVISSPNVPEPTRSHLDSTKHRVPHGHNDEELESLSPRELEILTLAGNGKSNKEIAVLVHISIKTVETHRNRINRKLDLHSIRDVVLCAVRNHLVSVEHSQGTSDRPSGSDFTQST
jgi:DNA-binding CsgD family transcriptional regulator